MKRKREWTIIKIISALILFAGVLTPVRADVIAEPQDPFYKEHAEECTYVGQYYRVIAVKGAFLYTAPQSAEILGQVPQRKEIWIDFTYVEEDGDSWGVQALEGELAGSSVWLNLADLQVEMNDAIFFKEHQAEIEQIDEVFAPEDFSGYLCFYEYPGADSVYEYTDAESLLEEPVTVNASFTTATGEIWLHTPYYFGHQGWFQRDQPVVEQAPLLNYQRGHILAAEDGTLHAAPPLTPQPVVVLTPETNRTDMPEERGSVRQYIAFSFSKDGLIGGLVLLVIAVTSGLIAVFWKKPKR